MSIIIWLNLFSAISITVAGTLSLISKQQTADLVDKYGYKLCKDTLGW